MMLFEQFLLVVDIFLPFYIYVKEDFDEFSDVDELYNTLPLDKVESLEDLVAIGPPALVKVMLIIQIFIDYYPVFKVH